MGEDPARPRGARHLRLLRPPDDQRCPRRAAELDRGPTHRPVCLGADHPLLRRTGKTGPALLTRRCRRPPHSRSGPSGLGRLPRLRRNLARSLPRRARVLVAFDDGRCRSPPAGLPGRHGPGDRAGRCRLPGLPAGTSSRSGDHSAVLAHLIPSPPRSQWRHRDRGPVDRACPGRPGERENRGRRLSRLRERARHCHPRHARQRSNHAGASRPARLLPRDDLRHMGRPELETLPADGQDRAADGRVALRSGLRLELVRPAAGSSRWQDGPEPFRRGA